MNILHVERVLKRQVRWPLDLSQSIGSQPPFMDVAQVARDII